MEPKLLEEKISQLQKDTWNFERSLRTAFKKENPKNYIVIQIVNRECLDLKRKVEELLSLHTQKTNDRFKIMSICESAKFYINKFEDAIRMSIDFDWDILLKLAQKKWKTK